MLVDAFPAATVDSAAEIPALYCKFSTILYNQIVGGNAKPEEPDNIAHTMLGECAHATVAATRSCFCMRNQTEFGASDWMGDLAYRYIK